MTTSSQRRWTVALWTAAIAAALISARYLLQPAPYLQPVQQSALARHPVLLLLHIGGGAVALALGPAQFVAGLRRSRPAVHRWSGRLYLLAVGLSGAAGLWLSRDTPRFLAEGFSEGRRLDIGIDPTALGLRPGSIFVPEQFTAVMWGFVALSLSWLLTGAMAIIRVQQGRFEQHRAWTTRNYALTFAAVSVRVLAIPLLLVTRQPVLAATLTFWSWILNLAVAEYLVRRSSRALPKKVLQVSAHA